MGEAKAEGVRREGNNVFARHGGWWMFGSAVGVIEEVKVVKEQSLNRALSKTQVYEHFSLLFHEFFHRAGYV